jgi:predicted dehydrogenase
MRHLSFPVLVSVGFFLAVLFALPRRGGAEEREIPQVALVGCAHIHTPHFIEVLKQHSGEVKVKCVWDHDAQRARRRATELGVPVVNDVNEIWSDPQIKAVVICSETNRHEPLILAAAKAHKHIYAEKPLGMGAQDSYAMARAIDDAGVMFQTGYFMRADPKLQFLKEQVDKNAFGKITRIRGSNCHNGALGGWFDTEWRWMADPRQAGVGAYGDLGTHSLDLMLWLIPHRVARGTATVSMGTARYPGCDEYGEGLFVFDNGIMGSLAAGWEDVSNPVTLEVCGTEGHATIVNDQLYFKSKHVSGSDDKKPWTQLPPAWPIPLEQFIAALNGQKAPLITADEAAYRCAVMEALYRGSNEKTWVEPRQPDQSGH